MNQYLHQMVSMLAPDQVRTVGKINTNVVSLFGREIKNAIEAFDRCTPTLNDKGKAINVPNLKAASDLGYPCSAPNEVQEAINAGVAGPGGDDTKFLLKMAGSIWQSQNGVNTSSSAPAVVDKRTIQNAFASVTRWWTKVARPLNLVSKIDFSGSGIDLDAQAHAANRPKLLTIPWDDVRWDTVPWSVLNGKWNKIDWAAVSAGKLPAAPASAPFVFKGTNGAPFDASKGGYQGYPFNSAADGVPWMGIPYLEVPWDQVPWTRIPWNQINWKALKLNGTPAANAAEIIAAVIAKQVADTAAVTKAAAAAADAVAATKAAAAAAGGGKLPGGIKLPDGMFPGPGGGTATPTEPYKPHYNYQKDPTPGFNTPGVNVDTDLPDVGFPNGGTPAPDGTPAPAPLVEYVLDKTCTSQIRTKGGSCAPVITIDPDSSCPSGDRFRGHNCVEYPPGWNDPATDGGSGIVDENGVVDSGAGGGAVQEGFDCKYHLDYARSKEQDACHLKANTSPEGQSAMQKALDSAAAFRSKAAAAGCAPGAVFDCPGGGSKDTGNGGGSKGTGPAGSYENMAGSGPSAFTYFSLGGIGAALGGIAGSMMGTGAAGQTQKTVIGAAVGAAVGLGIASVVGGKDEPGTVNGLGRPGPINRYNRPGPGKPSYAAAPTRVMGSRYVKVGGVDVLVGPDGCSFMANDGGEYYSKYQAVGKAIGVEHTLPSVIMGQTFPSGVRLPDSWCQRIRESLLIADSLADEGFIGPQGQPITQGGLPDDQWFGDDTTAQLGDDHRSLRSYKPRRFAAPVNLAAGRIAPVPTGTKAPQKAFSKASEFQIDQYGNVLKKDSNGILKEWNKIAKAVPVPMPMHKGNASSGVTACPSTVNVTCTYYKVDGEPETFAYLSVSGSSPEDAIAKVLCLGCGDPPPQTPSASIWLGGVYDFGAPVNNTDRFINCLRARGIVFAPIEALLIANKLI